MTGDEKHAARGSKRLAGRVALVTGASRGIGAAVAKAYAREGAHVILLARTTGGLEEVDDAIQSAGGTATLLPLDLMKPDQIAAIGPALADKFRRLDILVANAGILGPLSPVAMSSPKDWENAYKLNVMANYHLIRTLDPLLRGSDAGRAIFVTAAEAHRPPAFWSAYAGSKAALEAIVAAYAKEVAKSPLKVNIVDPGAVRTTLRSEAFPGENAQNLPAPEDVVETFIALASPQHSESGCLVRAA